MATSVLSLVEAIVEESESDMWNMFLDLTKVCDCVDHKTNQFEIFTRSEENKNRKLVQFLSAQIFYFFLF